MFWAHVIILFARWLFMSLNLDEFGYFPLFVGDILLDYTHEGEWTLTISLSCACLPKKMCKT